MIFSAITNGRNWGQLRHIMGIIFGRMIVWKMSGQLYIFLSRCSTQIKESCSRITSGKTLKMSLMRKKNGKIINLLIKKFVILNGLIL